MKSNRFFTMILVFCIANAIYSQQGWYKNYKGFIDNNPITLHLNRTGHEYFGYYYYDLYYQPGYFIGEDTSETGKIKLTLFLPNPDSTANFLFRIKDSIAYGEWQSNGQSKASSFSAKENIAPLSFDLINTYGLVKLRPRMTGSPAASYEAASVWPRGNSIQSVFLKRQINELFGEKNSTEDIGKIFLRQKKEYLNGYLKDNKDLKEADIRDSYAYNFDQSDRLVIVFQSSKLLALAILSSSYTGGAHGNYGTAFTSVDLLNNKKLRLDDVITAEGEKQLPALLEKYFRSEYALKGTDSLMDGGLFENKIEPNNNFYITPKGLGFNYTPYEIGPFAMGEITIFIPFPELTAYLRESFKKLID